MTPSDRRLLSLVVLSAGVVGNFGFLSGKSLVCVMIAVGLAIESLSGRTWGGPLPRWVGVGLVLALAATTVLYNRKLTVHPVFAATFVPLAAAILLYSAVRQRVARALALALGALAGLAGIVANLNWGFVDIDVFRFQQEASQALLNGHNPYSPVVRSPEFMAPGVRSFLQLHFPYGPILPVLEAPFRLLGDIRVLHIVAAVVISVAVLLLARRAGTLDRSACLVMAFPLTAGMVLFSWVDIITMAGLAVWFVEFRTHPRIAMFALVLALGAKPTTLIALVPVFFWSIRARRQVIIAAVLAAVIALPFVLVTGVSQFFYNVLGVQLEAFPRPDALTINAFLTKYGLPVLPFAASAVVIAAATVLVLWRRPRAYGDLLTGTAVLATVSFLVAKWAFFNYYYIPAVLLMLAIAGDGLALDAPEMISPPAVYLWLVHRLRGPMARLPGIRPLPGARDPGHARPARVP